ncbi:MAG: hypothetical protein ACI4XA_08620 [Oscillospiraceae bacterium]
MNARFHIPDFYLHWELNLNLIDKLKEHPEYFYDGTEIASCYGCFAPALWNGGRAVAGHSNATRISRTISEFNDRGVPIRYTFTNPTLTEDDLDDPFCNKICRAAENGFNEIIVNKDFLETYIRGKYPKYPIISSTVKQIEDLDTLLKEFEKDYKLVVLDYNWNNDFERLAHIPEELRPRCEILINPYCIPHCKRRAEHYRVLGESQRAASKMPVVPVPGSDNKLKASEFECVNTTLNFYQIQKYPTFVGLEGIKKYLDMGFNNFKIEGRTLSTPNVLESYMYYMVKPEYRDILRLELYLAPRRQPIELPEKKAGKNARAGR